MNELLTSATPDVARRGQELRAAIHAKVKSMQMAGIVKSMGHGTSDITSEVARFISVGSSMDSGVALLQAAGFKVERHSGRPNTPDRPAMVAKIDPYRSEPFRKMVIYVGLVPADPADWRIIGDFVATFVVHTI